MIPNPETHPDRAGLDAIMGRDIVARCLSTETIPLACKRLLEGLSATATKIFQRDGEIIYSKELPDYTARLEYVKAAFALTGANAPKDAQDGVQVNVFTNNVDIRKLVGAHTDDDA